MLPFRLDYVVKIATLRRLGGVRLGLEAIGLSIISLGLVDAVAMLPLAIAAIVTSGAIFRAPLIVVLLFCLGCIGVLALGPRLVRLPFVSRSERVGRIFTRVGDNAGFSRPMFVASGFLFGCWSMRALGSTLLLSALGVGFSPTLALVVICMAAAASILPITAGGAIVSIGATSGVLLALGVPKDAAVNFSLASGMLLTGAAPDRRVGRCRRFAALHPAAAKIRSCDDSVSRLLRAQAQAADGPRRDARPPGTKALGRLSKAPVIDEAQLRGHGRHDRAAGQRRRHGLHSCSSTAPRRTDGHTRWCCA